MNEHTRFGHNDERDAAARTYSRRSAQEQKSREIAEATARFLAEGKAVTKVPRGVTASSPRFGDKYPEGEQ